MFLGKAGTTAMAAGLFLALVSAAPIEARAQGKTPPDSPPGDPKELLEDATRKVLQAFELFMLTIPQYEMPEVLPNGDIIIRRKNPPPGRAPEKKQPEQTPPANGGAKT